MLALTLLKYILKQVNSTRHKITQNKLKYTQNTAKQVNKIIKIHKKSKQTNKLTYICDFKLNKIKMFHKI